MIAISPLEIQLIRSSISTKTDAEIAELLEIPVEDVIDIINEITEGGASDRNADVLKVKEEKNSVKRKLTDREQLLADKKVKEDIRRKEREKRANQDERKIVERRTSHERRRYKTRHQDFDNMISVKVDIKTWILVPAGTDIEKAKHQFIKNRK